MPETRTFLLEIGTEEIPASYFEQFVDRFLDRLLAHISNELTGEAHPESKIYYTPRRMTFICPGLPLEYIPDSDAGSLFSEIQGPPAKIAKDENGNWTMPAKKFAESQGVPESRLFIKKAGKGEYVFAKKKKELEKALDILASRVLPKTFKEMLSFPREMRWPQSDGTTFARPIRWICCLFGDEIVEFEFAGLTSSNVTYGHRFVHPEAITINHPDEYPQKLKKGFVLVNQDERKEEIAVELSKAAEELGGTLVQDEGLLAEVTNLVEYPKILACNLGGYTELPREVLQTALAKHQKAFVIEKKGRLIPHFLVVTNSPKLKPKLTKPWFERMAISRLEDADFFIKEDLDKGLKPLVEEEARVEWIKGIGSLADKTRWLTELGVSLGAKIEGFDKDTYTRAAHLAKADLLTNLVREKEFTSLQGIAGAIYAERLGESGRVCNAIREQYTDTPTSPESAVLAISDRLLNIAATFIAGKPPKGSSDPFALRRQAATLMKIIIEHKLPINLTAALERTLGLMNKKEKEKGRIASFLTERLRLYLKDRGFAYDWVDAVLAVAGDEPYDSWLRLSAFRELDKGEEFRLVAVGQKRVANITRELVDTPDPDTSIFGRKEEKTLWNETKRIRPDLEKALDRSDYSKALELLLSIRPAIDKFFDEVFVMIDDEKLRTNRLRLLAKVRDEFLRLADFSRMVVEGGEVA